MCRDSIHFFLFPEIKTLQKIMCQIKYLECSVQHREVTEYTMRKSESCLSFYREKAEEVLKCWVKSVI